MTDEKLPQESSEAGEVTNANQVVEENLDSTRMDIDVRQFSGKESTHTEIRVMTDEEKPVPKKIGADFFKKTAQAFSRLLAKKPKIKKGEKKRVIKASAHLPYMHLWLPPTDFSLPAKILFYFSRLVILVLSFSVNAFLVHVAYRATMGANPFQWVMVGVAGVSCILTIIVIVLRRSVAAALGIPFLSVLGLLTTNIYCYPLSDPTFLPFFGLAPSFVLNQVMGGMLVLEILFILLISPAPWLFKVAEVILCLFGLSGFVLNIIQNVPLQASWMGLGVLAQIPFLYLKPIVFSFEILFPFLFFMSAIFSFVYFSKIKQRGSGSWVVLHLLILVASAAIGLGLMQNAGIENVLSLFWQKPIPYGRALFEHAGLKLELKTKTSSQNNSFDRLVFSINSDVKNPQALLVTVKDVNGFPAYFLSKDQLNLSVGDELIKDWDWALLEKAGEASYFLKAKWPEAKPIEEIKVPVVAEIATAPSLQIEAPMEGDTFGDSLSVLASLKGVDSLQKISFAIDEKIVSEKNLPPLSDLIDTTLLTKGNHRLKITAILSSGQTLEKEVGVTKGEFSSVDILQPTLGAYVHAQESIIVSVDGTSMYTSMDLIVDGEKIYSWETPFLGAGPAYVWNTGNLKAGEHLVKVHAATSNGLMATTDWVLVSTGESTLTILPVDGSLSEGGGAGGKKITPYKKVVFIINGSITSLDYWGVRSKWEEQTSLILSDRLKALTKDIDIGIMAFGTNKAAFYKDCNDVELVSDPPSGSLNKDKLSKAFASLHPQGVSSLFKAVEMALKEKPDKIIVLTDSTDSCSSKIPPGLQKALGANQKTIIDVLAFNPLATADQASLTDLSKMMNGHFILVSNTEELEKEIDKQFTLRYQLISNDQVILDQEIDGEKVIVRPGDYIVKIKSHPTFNDQPISLTHGQNMSYRLSPKGDSAVLVKVE